MSIKTNTLSSIRKKPWNRVDLPVYSLSTSNAAGQHNMHICTYVSAVSMQPKRMMVAIYHGTQTLLNATQNPNFVLQLLAHNQYNLVNQLGKQSGKTIDKIGRLQKRKLLTEWQGYYVLTGALAVMELHTIAQIEGGDHRLFVADVVSYKNLNDGEALTTKILHQKGIIRI
ncbi:MAG: flavin reductase [Bacteroidetes bacterium]|nr:MAG: flavin reductase [Bacteroidota bacterium]